ncbi:MAG: metallophosphoesterase family protein [Anaerolineales bacterium]|nr:metallophosphoesterase family protein [Anaerolineales bacterium]
MTRLAILSDIHGNLPALEAVAADLSRRGVERVVNLGDHLSGPLWPQETADFLRGRDWNHVMGNHDRRLVTQDPAEHGSSDHYAYTHTSEDARAWLACLPARVELDGGLLLFHGTPTDDTAYLLETVNGGHVRLADPVEIRQRLGAVSAALILCGHSHVPRLVALPGQGLILNPGSVGLQAYDDTAPEPHVIENGSPHARYALLEKHGPDWQAEFVLVPYDHPAAAAQAHRNARPDWERALQTGYFFLENKPWK